MDSYDRLCIGGMFIGLTIMLIVQTIHLQDIHESIKAV